MGILLTEGSMLGSMGAGFVMVIYIVLIFGFVYFASIRPQKKEQKRVGAMLAGMEIGDSVLTTSGFYGVLIDISDDTVIVEFGNNKNCRVPMQKSAIAQVEKAGEEEDKKQRRQNLVCVVFCFILKERSGIKFFFAVFATINLFVSIRKHENMRKFLLDRSDTSWILAFKYIFYFFR